MKMLRLITLWYLEPRGEHLNPESYDAKIKELRNFEDYNVYEVVDRPNNENIIGTQWVLVDKEIPGENKLKRKARLCMRGYEEENVEKIPKDAPTVNRININLMLTEAVRQGYKLIQVTLQELSYNQVQLKGTSM